ncbi:DsbA family protein [Devosia sp. RR2S18]|uniref:DsbA family protein n=1 Tax=Devosia rhizosphaerae TaxID=3049774 RepID=UPI00254237AD|nr:DsbA family protein [Devosia sp. RR2S18]WIJ25824.1 DsbA family protein [Devosia sp. RR2S18]
MPGTLDVFYFPGSTYTYLSALRGAALAEQSGLILRWRPFNVRAIMVEMDNIPFAKKPAKAAYMWRAIERRAKRYGLPWAGQPPYPVDPELKALRMATVATLEGYGLNSP